MLFFKEEDTHAHGFFDVSERRRFFSMLFEAVKRSRSKATLLEAEHRFSI